jgi:hypothetical protein
VSKAAQEKLNKYGIEKICGRIANANAQRTIAKDIGVDWVTMTAWINADDARIQQYARAREVMADNYAEESIAIADSDCNEEGLDGRMRVSSALVAQKRLQYDARKWYVSKLAPKRYGDKLDVTSEGKTINPMQTLLDAVSGTALATK